MKDRGRVNWINAGRKKRGKRSSRQPALRDEAEKKLKKEKCVYGSKLWRERERDRVSDNHMGVGEGVCSMSIQMLNHSRAFIQLKFQPCFKVRCNAEKKEGWR